MSLLLQQKPCPETAAKTIVNATAIALMLIVVSPKDNSKVIDGAQMTPSQQQHYFCACVAETCVTESADH